jgi:hypothetical protein
LESDREEAKLEGLKEKRKTRQPGRCGLSVPDGIRQLNRKQVVMNTVTSDDMAGMFGATNMTNCTEVAEVLAINGDGYWEMTRTYKYADGTSKDVAGEAEGYYCLVPASPGWIVATDHYYDDPLATRQHHAVAMWRYSIEGRDHRIMPLIPGDTSRVTAVAVISPDWRVFEVAAHGILQNVSYPSIEAWHDRIAQERAKLEAEEDRREKSKCPHCGHVPARGELPF